MYVNRHGLWLGPSHEHVGYVNVSTTKRNVKNDFMYPPSNC